MANEKRLIDTNPAYIQAVLSKVPYYTDEIWKFAAMTQRFPAVDAVEVVEYIELREQYDKIFTEFYELRDAFVDYVCSGVRNPSPFCKNKCPGCCDSYGWCKHDDKCKGFNPAEIFTGGDKNGSK